MYMNNIATYIVRGQRKHSTQEYTANYTCNCELSGHLWMCYYGVAMSRNSNS